MLSSSNSFSIVYSVLCFLPPVVLSVVCTVSSIVYSALYYFPPTVCSMLYFLPSITGSMSEKKYAEKNLGTGAVSSNFILFFCSFF